MQLPIGNTCAYILKCFEKKVKGSGQGIFASFGLLYCIYEKTVSGFWKIGVTITIAIKGGKDYGDQSYRNR